MLFECLYFFFSLFFFFIVDDLKDVKSLKLHNCQYLNDSCLKKLHPLSETLQLLQVSASNKVTNAGIASLTVLK